MRIAFSSPRASHLEHSLAHGGDPIFVEHLVAALRRRGHDVRIATRLDVRDVWRGRVPRRRVPAEALHVARTMWRFRPDAWLVYNPSPTYPDLFGWWQRPGRYVLLSAHTWRSRRLTTAWRTVLGWAHERSLARADAVVTPRPETADRLRRDGVAPDRLWVLPPAVPVPEAVPGRARARSLLGLPADATLVLCVSRLTGPDEAKEQKTAIVLDLLRAVRQLPPQAVLVLVGDGPGRPAVERAVRELGLGARVVLAGARAFAELTSFYAACDLYAYPDRLDRPRLSVLDAQAHGRPVVALRTPSAELVVDDGRTGVLAADREEFAALLAQLAGDRRRREALGDAARRFVQESHSIDVRAGQLESLLRGDRPAVPATAPPPARAGRR